MSTLRLSIAGSETEWVALKKRSETQNRSTLAHYRLLHPPPLLLCCHRCGFPQPLGSFGITWTIPVHLQFDSCGWFLDSCRRGKETGNTEKKAAGPEQTGSALQRSRGSGSRQPRRGRQPAGSPQAGPGGRFGP